MNFSNLINIKSTDNYCRIVFEFLTFIWAVTTNGDQNTRAPKDRIAPPLAVNLSPTLNYKNYLII